MNTFSGVSSIVFLLDGFGASENARKYESQTISDLSRNYASGLSCNYGGSEMAATYKE